VNFYRERTKKREKKNIAGRCLKTRIRFGKIKKKKKKKKNDNTTTKKNKKR